MLVEPGPQYTNVWRVKHAHDGGSGDMFTVLPQCPHLCAYGVTACCHCRRKGKLCILCQPEST